MAKAMTDMSMAEARVKGLRVDERAGADRIKIAQFIYQPESLYERLDPGGAPEQTCYSLLGLAALSYAPDRMPDAMAANIAAEQMANGSWHLEQVARPPAEEGDIFRTGLCVRALKAYSPPGCAGEMTARIFKARQWLLGAKPYTAEDRNIRLLGLHSAGADAGSLKRLAKAILAQQQPRSNMQAYRHLYAEHAPR